MIVSFQPSVSIVSPMAGSGGGIGVGVWAGVRVTAGVAAVWVAVRVAVAARVVVAVAACACCRGDAVTSGAAAASEVGPLLARSACPSPQALSSRAPQREQRMNSRVDCALRSRPSIPCLLALLERLSRRVIFGPSHPCTNENRRPRMKSDTM